MLFVLLDGVDKSKRWLQENQKLGSVSWLKFRRKEFRSAIAMDSTEETNFNASEHGGRTAEGQEGRTGGPRGRDGGEGVQIVGQECQNGGEDDSKKSGQTVEVDVQVGQVEDDGAEVGGQYEDDGANVGGQAGQVDADGVDADGVDAGGQAGKVEDDGADVGGQAGQVEDDGADVGGQAGQVKDDGADVGGQAGQVEDDGADVGGQETAKATKREKRALKKLRSKRKLTEEVKYLLFPFFMKHSMNIHKVFRLLTYCHCMTFETSTLLHV